MVTLAYIQIETLAAKTVGEGQPKTPWFLYIIEANDRSLYTGITTDVARRFKEHGASGRGARYFNGRNPVAVVYTEECDDRAHASRREFEIKSMSAPQKRQLIAEAGQRRFPEIS